MSLRKIITTELADQIADILVGDFNRIREDYLRQNKRKDITHLNLAARRVGYTPRKEDMTLLLSSVNTALERYWVLTSPITRPDFIDMKPSAKRYGRQENI